MPDPAITSPDDRQWRLLLVYNLYRVLSLLLLIGLYYYNSVHTSYSAFFFSTSLVYFIFAVFALYAVKSQHPCFNKQVLCTGTVDVFALSLIVSLIDNIQPGQRILLNVTIAALSILAPGYFAIFFAALASCLLLCGSALQFILNHQKDLGSLYDSGIYGAGLFATALTAWYLSNWVRASEDLARRRSNELASMQRINEYIVARLHSGIIYVDEKQSVKFINSAARIFFNLNHSLPILRLNQVSLLLSEKLANFLAKAKKKEQIGQSILEEPYLRVHFFSTVSINGPAVLIIVDDMTYIAQQAQQLKLASLGRFSASIAHELRNPLGAIAHAGQLLGDEGYLNEEDQRLKQLIINNCERMNGVIKNVLQLSRREKSHPQVIELSSFLDHFKQGFCHSNQCTIINKIPKKKLSIIFDRSQLEQILVILCENSIKHGSNKDGQVNILIQVKNVAQSVSIIVSDSGAGVPEKYKDSIFEPFFTTLRQGTGMGLFIARDLCEINQARLNLITFHKGSAFSITQNPSDELLL